MNPSPSSQQAISWNSLALFSILFFFICQQCVLNYHLARHYLPLLTLAGFDVLLLLYLLTNRSSDFAALKGGSCWVAYVWALTVKVVIFFFLIFSSTQDPNSRGLEGRSLPPPTPFVDANYFNHPYFDSYYLINSTANLQRRRLDDRALPATLHRPHGRRDSPRPSQAWQREDETLNGQLLRDAARSKKPLPSEGYAPPPWSSEAKHRPLKDIPSVERSHSNALSSHEVTRRLEPSTGAASALPPHSDSSTSSLDSVSSPVGVYPSSSLAPNALEDDGDTTVGAPLSGPLAPAATETEGAAAFDGPLDPASPAASQPGLLFSGPGASVLEVAFFVALAGLMFGLLSFRAAQPMFGGIQVISTEQMIHTDGVVHVVLDLVDISVAFFTFAGLPSSVASQTPAIHTLGGLVIAASLFLHAYSFPSVGSKGLAPLTPFNQTDRGDIGDVFMARKHAALVGIWCVDVPLACLRLFMWAYFSTFEGFSPWLFKNICLIPLQFARFRQCSSAARLKLEQQQQHQLLQQPQGNQPPPAAPLPPSQHTPSIHGGAASYSSPVPAATAGGPAVASGARQRRGPNAKQKAPSRRRFLVGSSGGEDPGDDAAEGGDGEPLPRADHREDWKLPMKEEQLHEQKYAALLLSRSSLHLDSRAASSLFAAVVDSSPSLALRRRPQRSSRSAVARSPGCRYLARPSFYLRGCCKSAPNQWTLPAH
eukprot:GHVT01088608.1.p1 GENE.GHVT01088608.1~~GHVT01088608.1.p1  ORF type:complete len:709 (-),score=184.15 GHVT01088608.1:2097-4223(-)